MFVATAHSSERVIQCAHENSGGGASNQGAISNEMGSLGSCWNMAPLHSHPINNSSPLACLTNHWFAAPPAALHYLALPEGNLRFGGGAAHVRKQAAVRHRTLCNTGCHTKQPPGLPWAAGGMGQHTSSGAGSEAGACTHLLHRELSTQVATCHHGAIHCKASGAALGFERCWAVQPRWSGQRMHQGACLGCSLPSRTEQAAPNQAGKPARRRDR